MAITRWSFPNGVDGDTLTAPLAGADTVNFSGVATLENDHPLNPGGLGARLYSDVSGHQWFAKEGLSSTSYAVDFYIYIPTAAPNVSVTTYFMWAGASSSLRSAGIQMVAARQLRINTSDVTPSWTSGVLPLDTMIRVSAFVTCSATTGTVRLAWYLGSNTTPQEDSGTITGLNTQANIDRIRIGPKAATTAGTTEMWIASWAYDPVATGLLAPAAGPVALAVDAGDDQTAEVGEGTLLGADITGGTVPYTVAWTVESGAGTFDDSTSATTVFTPTSAGTHVLRVTATDSVLATEFDDVTITATDALSPTAASGWTSVEGGAVDRLDAVTDSSATTYVQTAANPTSEVLTLTLPAVLPPAADLTCQVTLSVGVGAATVTPRLYRPAGTTLVSTASAIDVTTSITEYVVTFSAADITTAALDPTSDWAAGMIVTYTAVV